VQEKVEEKVVVTVMVTVMPVPVAMMAAAAVLALTETLEVRALMAAQQAEIKHKKVMDTLIDRPT